MQRRSLILTALAAPFVVRTPGLLMPVRPVRPAGVKRWVCWHGPIAPVDPPRGELWFDTSRNVLRVFTGKTWGVVVTPPWAAA